jgi:sensor histidine kinase YesM
VKTYNIKPGLIISLSIGCIFSLRLFVPLKKMFPRQNLRADLGLNDILLSVFIVSLFAFCCWIIHQYIVQTRFRWQPLNKTWIKAIGGIILCMLLSQGFELVQRFYYNQFFVSETEVFKKLFFLNLRGVIIGGFQFFMVYYIAALSEAQQAKIEIEHLKQENLEVRLNLLKQQISPHFLFNSLSTLRTIAPDNNTKQYVMQLSNVYRYLLNYNDNNVATLKDELAFTNSYLYILKERFEDALQVTIQVPESFLSKKIPPLALQILIENAIKHNVISPDEPLHINIHSEGEDKLTVSNNLQTRLSIEKSTGKGLQNINDRYHLLSGKQIDIIDNGKTFIVKLPLLPS